MPSRRERIEGGVAGLLIGDALGVPYEFHDPDEIPPGEQIEYGPLLERLVAIGRRRIVLQHYRFLASNPHEKDDPSALDSTAQALYI